MWTTAWRQTTFRKRCFQLLAAMNKRYEKKPLYKWPFETGVPSFLLRMHWTKVNKATCLHMVFRNSVSTCCLNTYEQTRNNQPVYKYDIFFYMLLCKLWTKGEQHSLYKMPFDTVFRPLVLYTLNKKVNSILYQNNFRFHCLVCKS